VCKMREQKFRAWDFDGKCYYYFSMKDVLHRTDLRKIMPPPENNPQAYDYVGRSDKNGDDIYEGTIIKWDEKHGGRAERVRWDAEDLAWVCDSSLIEDENSNDTSWLCDVNTLAIIVGDVHSSISIESSK